MVKNALTLGPSYYQGPADGDGAWLQAFLGLSNDIFVAVFRMKVA